VKIYSDVAFRLAGDFVPAAQQIAFNSDIFLIIAGAGFGMGGGAHIPIHALGKHPRER
jgi:hypothetical protein